MKKSITFFIAIFWFLNASLCGCVSGEVKNSVVKPGYRMGIEYASVGEFSEAESWFQTNLKKNKKDFTSISSLAVIRDLKTGKITKNYAISFFKGLNDLQNEATEEAIEELHKTINLEPSYPRPYNVLGVILAASGDSKSALNFFKKAIELNPDYIEACFNIAALYQSLGNRDEALKFYSKIIEQDPGAVDALISAASISASQGSYAHATKLYENALKSDQGEPDIYYNLALAYFMADDLINFKKDLLKAQALYQQKGDAVGIKKVESYLIKAKELEKKIQQSQ